MTKFKKCSVARTKTVRLDPIYVNFPFFRSKCSVFLTGDGDINTSDTKISEKQVQNDENHNFAFEAIGCVPP